MAGNEKADRKESKEEQEMNGNGMKITCPHCGMALNIDDIYMAQMREEMEKRNRIELQEALTRQMETVRKESEDRQKEAVENARKEQELLIGKLTRQIELLSKAQEQSVKDAKAAQEKEFELQQKVQAAELEAQRKFMEQAREIEEKARKQAEEASQMEILKLNKQIEDAKKETTEIQKKLNQGSQQLQGEVQELRLEECLRAEFPLDIIEEVEKGRNGADVIQTVRNISGRICGTIVWESKNVKTWKKDFLPKIRSDMERVNGEVGIIMSNVFGKNMEEFTCVDGVWLVKPSNAVSMARLIRERVIKVGETMALAKGKETIQDAVYEFVTSQTFRNRIENIGNQYKALDDEIDRCKNNMLRSWETQRKLIDGLVNNTQDILGDVNAFLLQSGTPVGEVSGEEE